MLVLTASAYKMAISGKLPDISYLTVLDKYNLLCALFIVLVCVQSRCLNWLIEWGISLDGLRRFDRWSFGVFGGFWVLLQLWYGFAIYRLTYDLVLRDTRAAAILADEGIVTTVRRSMSCSEVDSTESQERQPHVIPSTARRGGLSESSRVRDVCAKEMSRAGKNSSNRVRLGANARKALSHLQSLPGARRTSGFGIPSLPAAKIFAGHKGQGEARV